jgi:hypothetical protein
MSLTMRDFKSQKPKALTKPAAPEEDGVCAGHALGFPLRSDLGFLPIEDITVDLFRCVCDVYASGSAKPWEIAMTMAEERLGPSEGPHFVALVTALLRALRIERKTGFSYLSIGCNHISPDELTVAGLLKSLRARDASSSERGFNMTLANPEPGARTRLAAQALATAQLRFEGRNRPADAGSADFETEAVQAFYVH